MRQFTFILFVCCCVSPVQAALLLYDGFDYNAGEFLAATGDTVANPNGQYNAAYDKYWHYAGGTAANNAAPHIASGSLSVAGMPAPLGNSVGFDMTKIGSARIEIPGTSASSNTGTFYWSAFFRVNDVGTLTSGASGMLLGGFNNTPGPGVFPSVVGATLLIRKDDSDPEVNNVYQIGSGVNTAAASRFFATEAPQSAGDTVFIVASYEYNPGTTDDVVRMWINPDPSTFHAASPPAATISGTLGAGSELSAVRTFNLRNVSGVGLPDLQFDELRVGTTWASVTIPEPASLSLLAIAGVLVYSRRRAAGR